MINEADLKLSNSVKIKSKFFQLKVYSVCAYTIKQAAF